MEGDDADAPNIAFFIVVAFEDFWSDVLFCAKCDCGFVARKTIGGVSFVPSLAVKTKPSRLACEAPVENVGALATRPRA